MIAEKVIRGITFTDTVEFVVIGSRKKETAETFVAAMAAYLPPSCVAVEGYQSVLDFPNLDAVYIPLPSALHAEWVEKAASKGLHILLEKPTAASDKDHALILAAVEANKVCFMDGTMWSHHKRAKKIEEIISAKNIGSVVNVESSFTFLGDESFFTSNVRISAEADPLGALGDLGWYCVRASLFSYEFEPPISVQAHPGSILNDEGVVLAAGATLIWPGGRKATFSCGFNQALTQNLFIAGTEGSISVDDFVIPKQEDVAYFTLSSGHGLGKFNTHSITNYETCTVLMEKPQECLMWEEFARCAISPEDRAKWTDISRLTMKVILAIKASISQQHSLIGF
jgi:predicted dehydrogenase